MLTDTPRTEMTSLKKPGRLKIRPTPYDENDSVMKDIQERMKQKRKKKADLSRSRRLNITNASLMLKLSLRANNRALAKALEEAQLEGRQDKEMIFEQQCALEAAQQELKQCHQMIQDLKLEGQSMIGMLTTLQESEESHRKRVAQVKTLLNEVTAKYLLNTVALIDKAAGICNTPSLSKASSIFIRKSSVSEDDSSRDTFSALTSETQGIERFNIYCRNGKTAKGEEAALEISAEQTEQTESHVIESLGIDEEIMPSFDNQTDIQLKRRSSTSRKRSRTAFFLDPKEMQHALTSEVRQQSLICEEKEDLSSSVAEFAASGSDGSPQEVVGDNPKYDIDDKPQKIHADGPDSKTDKILSVDSVSYMDKVEIGDKNQFALEKTDYPEQGMELTSKEEKDLQDNTNQGDVPLQMESEVGKVKDTGEGMQDRELIKENKTVKKTNIRGKKSGKGKKNLTKKQLKKVSVKRALLKVRDEGSQGTSVFDLSESFSQPVSPHQHQKEKKFEQNLSTESEKSEPGETMSSGVTNKSYEHGRGSEETKEEGEEEKLEDDEMDEDNVVPVETLEEESQPKMCHRSRQSHGTVRHGSSVYADEMTNGSVGDTVLASPFGEELSVSQRTLKPLSQALNESSCKEGTDYENSNALSIKAKMNKNTIKPKQKKRLYDPKKSLDKEFTHTIISSSQDGVLPYSDNGTNRNSTKLKKRHWSGTVGKEERVKEISNESLSGLLEESWMKDFLNDIDSEDEGKPTARTSASRKKSQLKTRATRKTFRVDSCMGKESNENILIDDASMEVKDYSKKVNGRKVIRRGTVCLKKGSEGLSAVDFSESTLRGGNVDALSTIDDGVNRERISDLATGKGKVKNCASFVVIDGKKELPLDKVRNVIRRGTFDIEPQLDEDGNMKGMIDEKVEQSEKRSEKGDKNEGEQKKRKSDFMEKDGEEVEGDTHGMTSRKRQKKGKEEYEEWIQAEEETCCEESGMVKRTSRRESKRDTSKIPNPRRETQDIKKKEIEELADKLEDGDSILEVQGDVLENKDENDNGEEQEKCSKLQSSKMRDGISKELAKINKKQSKIPKVPRPKKKIIVEESSDENASHDDSISSVESVSLKTDKSKKQSGIPRRKEGSKSLQNFENVRGRENNSMVNGNGLKMKHLPEEAKLDNEMDAKSQGIISSLGDGKAVTFDKKELAKEIVADVVGKKSEVSKGKRNPRELEREVTEDEKDDGGWDMAEEKIQEEQDVKMNHAIADKDQNCDKEDTCEVYESGDASVPEETRRTEETGEAEMGRRPSRQARAKAAQSLKEPSLSRKLRRGDPFTDNMLLTSPMVKNKKMKKKKVSQNRKSRSALDDATNVI